MGLKNRFIFEGLSTYQNQRFGKERIWIITHRRLVRLSWPMVHVWAKVLINAYNGIVQKFLNFQPTIIFFNRIFYWHQSNRRILLVKYFSCSYVQQLYQQKVRKISHREISSVKFEHPYPHEDSDFLVIRRESRTNVRNCT